MSTLPVEILTFTFGYLKTKNLLQSLLNDKDYLKTTDLLQCQLTSKAWYQASVDLLYSEVEISTSERSRLFGLTMSNYLHLGARLKIIHTLRLFVTKKDNELWNEHGLINKLIQNCPNLLKIYNRTQDYSFWYRISHAASRGHLSRLQVLPGSGYWNLEPYIHTALHFKVSLTHLSIHDRYCILGTDLNSLEVYQELLDQIDEFKKLQNFELLYRSNKQLSCFDTLIDNCPHLEELDIRLVSTERQRNIIEHEELSISPRPDIRKLKCNWCNIKGNLIKFNQIKDEVFITTRYSSLFILFYYCD